MSEKVFFLSFDANMETYTKRRAYAKFVKALKSEGYRMLQESVYVRYTDSCATSAEETDRIKRITPESVQVRMIALSYEQFERMANINCEKIRFYAREHIICV